jgi:[glutamine synthetase] adenylyltransferase / [glutamine synthetase]-adenylyl-L-tyrosine phosphorylase
MKLLSRLSPEGDGLPDPGDARLLELGLAAWSEALTHAGNAGLAEAAVRWSASRRGRRLLAAIFGNSPYLTAIAVNEWGFLTRLVAEGPDPLFAEIIEATETTREAGEDRASLMRRLRTLKRRVALLAAVADLALFWSLEEETAGLSRFAEAALGAGLRHLLGEAARAGRIAPEKAAESGCGFIVLALGKLGGGELNYSSDIDLIFLYDPSRAEVFARDGMGPFFVRLGRELLRLLDERTADGYVFRTDLRLRPDPASTPLALSVPAALAYYEEVGQNWERAALIKARPVAGDKSAGWNFLRQIGPYIWRKHLDFAAIADIHSIKRQIHAHRGGERIAVLGHDIKVGRGGIREIEFFTQTQQLIWGGRMREVRVAPTCEALRRLAECRRIDAASAEALIADYRFLRRVEHRLQMADDAQTHRLPSDSRGIERLAAFLGYPASESFVAELLAHLLSVEKRYAELFEEAPSLSGPGNLVFTGVEDDPDTLGTLRRLGFVDAKAVSALVRGWHHGRWRATRSQRAREILTELVPALLRIFGATHEPDGALERFDQFLSRQPAGVQLLSLFYANPTLLELVADIMATAPRLAGELAARPGLLDSVLSEGLLAPFPDLGALAADLHDATLLARDFEEILDGLRRWAAERRFQIGVRLLFGGLDAEAAGEALADIAESALAALLPAVESEFRRAHGRVAGGAFAVIGMGRLGSGEMTLASDLDLILVYEMPPEGATSDGARPLAAQAYYARLGQRLIGALTAPGNEGRLYPVDMRLRPSGASGPLATSFSSFVRYQREAAWTWEHMALTRARPVAGDKALCRRCEAAIAGVLELPRDPARLLFDVADMRRRIAEQNPNPSPWDIRNRRGGLIDLEFIVQYLLLREGCRDPRVLRRGTRAALEALAAAGALPSRAARELEEAFSLFRRAQMLLTLFLDAMPKSASLPEPIALSLARAAGFVDSKALERDISRATARVRSWYRRLIDGRAAKEDPQKVGESER